MSTAPTESLKSPCLASLGRGRRGRFLRLMDSNPTDEKSGNERAASQSVEACDSFPGEDVTKGEGDQSGGDRRTAEGHSSDPVEAAIGDWITDAPRESTIRYLEKHRLVSVFQVRRTICQHEKLSASLTDQALLLQMHLFRERHAHRA